MFTIYFRSIKIAFIACLVLLTSCGKTNKASISGELSNSIIATLYLTEFDLVSNKIIDSVQIKANGKFKFKVKLDAPRFYQIMFNQSNFILLLVEPGEKIKIIANASNLNQTYTVEGSKLSNDVQLLNSQLSQTKQTLDSLNRIALANAEKPDYVELVTKLDSQYIETLKAQRKFSIKFILENLNSMASIVALYQQIDNDNYVLNSNRDLQYVKLVSDSLLKHYPETKIVKTLYADRTRLLSELNKLKLSSAIDKANTASFPEILLPSTTGENISLSKIKGKMIILNFWDPTNEDCMYVLKGLKDIYAKHKKNGLEIYNVAITNDIAVWKGIVNRYNLAGIQVIDPTVNNSYTLKVYNVQKLPSNYILSNKGIEAKDIFGENLENYISQNMK